MGSVGVSKKTKKPGLKPWFYACNLLIIKSILLLIKLVAEDGLLVGYQGVRLRHYGLAPDLA